MAETPDDINAACQVFRQGDIVEGIPLFELVEGAIGWAEALVFAYGKTTERDMVRQLLQSGQNSS